MTMWLTGARVVTPEGVLDEHAVAIADGRITALAADVPAGARRATLDGGWLLPGFIDTQVNGGGGVMLNDALTVDRIATIAAAHRRFGTTALLPTLITDTLDVVAATLDAIDAAIDAGVPGVIGCHIEGPFLNPAKKGIHDAAKFRRIDDEAIALLTRPGKGVRLVTIAPELAPPGAIRRLREAGVLVAAAHSMATFEEGQAAFGEGLSGVTHLFNAMTGLESRAPGLVGAALADRTGHFGLIVDGHHVHPAALNAAIDARGIDGAMLVTDAMATTGTDLRTFELMGRTIRVEDDGTLRAEDGTLAGAALDMAAAVRNTMQLLGRSVSEASAMASGNPARFLGLAGERGAIAAGLRADLVWLDDTFAVRRVWVGGEG